MRKTLPGMRDSNIDNLGIFCDSIGFRGKNASNHGSMGSWIIKVAVQAVPLGDSATKVRVRALDARVNHIGECSLSSSVIVAKQGSPWASGRQ